MSQTFETVINFVSSVNNVPGTSPATGDLTCLSLLVLMLVCALGFCAIYLAKSKAFNIKGIKNSGPSINTSKSNVMLIVCAAIIAIVSLSSVVLSINKSAFANSQESDVSLTPQINATVNDDGSIVFDTAILKSNIPGKVIKYDYIKTDLCEGIPSMDNVTWQIDINDSTIYKSVVPGTNISKIYFKDENKLILHVDGMDAELAKSLIGKSVFKISLDVEAVEMPSKTKTLTLGSDNYGKLKNGIWGTPQDCDLVFMYPFDSTVAYKVDVNSAGIIEAEGQDSFEIFDVNNDPDAYYFMGWYLNDIKQEKGKYFLEDDALLQARHDNYINFIFETDEGGQLKDGSGPATSDPIVYSVPKNCSYKVYNDNGFTYIEFSGMKVTNVNADRYRFENWIDIAGNVIEGSADGKEYVLGDSDFTLTATHTHLSSLTLTSNNSNFAHVSLSASETWYDTIEVDYNQQNPYTEPYFDRATFSEEPPQMIIKDVYGLKYTYTTKSGTLMDGDVQDSIGSAIHCNNWNLYANGVLVKTFSTDTFETYTLSDHIDYVLESVFPDVTPAYNVYFVPYLWPIATVGKFYDDYGNFYNPWDPVAFNVGTTYTLSLNDGIGKAEFKYNGEIIKTIYAEGIVGFQCTGWDHVSSGTITQSIDFYAIFE